MSRLTKINMFISRNPNEGTVDFGTLNSRPERTKLKNIDWTAYEAVHKKYLSIGNLTFLNATLLELKR